VLLPQKEPLIRSQMETYKYLKEKENDKDTDTTQKLN
jgi:hypothetical protein